jgi:hypothetical protein
MLIDMFAQISCVFALPMKRMSPQVKETELQALLRDARAQEMAWQEHRRQLENKERAAAVKIAKDAADKATRAAGLEPTQKPPRIPAPKKGMPVPSTPGGMPVPSTPGLAAPSTPGLTAPSTPGLAAPSTPGPVRKQSSDSSDSDSSSYSSSDDSDEKTDSHDSDEKKEPEPRKQKQPLGEPQAPEEPEAPPEPEEPPPEQDDEQMPKKTEEAKKKKRHKDHHKEHKDHKDHKDKVRRKDAFPHRKHHRKAPLLLDNDSDLELGDLGIKIHTDAVRR